MSVSADESARRRSAVEEVVDESEPESQSSRHASDTTFGKKCQVGGCQTLEVRPKLLPVRSHDGWRPSADSHTPLSAHTHRGYPEMSYPQYAPPPVPLLPPLQYQLYAPYHIPTYPMYPPSPWEYQGYVPPAPSHPASLSPPDNSLTGASLGRWNDQEGSTYMLRESDPLKTSHESSICQDPSLAAKDRLPPTANTAETLFYPAPSQSFIQSSDSRPNEVPPDLGWDPLYNKGPQPPSELSRDIKYLKIEVLETTSNLQRVHESSRRVLDLSLNSLRTRINVGKDFKERVCVLPLHGQPTSGEAVTLTVELYELPPGCGRYRLARVGTLELAAVLMFVRTSALVTLPFTMCNSIALYPADAKPGLSLAAGEAQLKLTFSDMVGPDEKLMDEIPVNSWDHPIRGRASDKPQNLPRPIKSDVPPEKTSEVFRSSVTLTHTSDDDSQHEPKPSTRRSLSVRQRSIDEKCSNAAESIRNAVVQLVSTIESQLEPSQSNSSDRIDVYEALLMLDCFISNDTACCPEMAYVSARLGEYEGHSAIGVCVSPGTISLKTALSFTISIEICGNAVKPMPPDTVLQVGVYDPQDNNVQVLRGEARFRKTLETLLRLPLERKMIAFKIPLAAEDEVRGHLLCHIQLVRKSMTPINESLSLCAERWKEHLPPGAVQLPRTPSIVRLPVKVSGFITSFQPNEECDVGLIPFFVVYNGKQKPQTSRPVKHARSLEEYGRNVREYRFVGPFEFSFQNAETLRLRFEVWCRESDPRRKLGSAEAEAPRDGMSFASLRIIDSVGEVEVGILSVCMASSTSDQARQV